MNESGSRSDPIRLIETAYTYVLGEKEWLTMLVGASAPYDVGRGVLACTVELGAQPRVRTLEASDAAAEVAGSIAAFVENVPPKLAGEMFAPTEFVGNAEWRYRRLTSPSSAAAPDPPPALWALIAGDGRSDAIVVAFPAATTSFAPGDAFPHRDRKILGLVGAHLGAALRLRHQAAPQAEAVLTPDGKVLDAQGLATSPQARQSLTEAVLRAERARGKLRRTDDEEATELWRALVDGRWSIVEVVERDGKRLLLARANTHRTPTLTDLTKGESDVVWLTAFGHAFKYIGYELGLSTSAVVRRLKSAMLKLGVSTRAELIRKLGR